MPPTKLDSDNIRAIMTLAGGILVIEHIKRIS